MKSRFWFHLCLICTLMLVIGSCKVKRPDDLIPESKMENLLYDYHLAKAMSDNLSYAENYKKAVYVDAVFQKYGTTEAVFDSSLVWYTRNTEILSKIYEKINKRFKAEQDKINHLIALRDKKLKMSEPGDSIDVWPWQRLVRLSGQSPESCYKFVLSTDSNYKDRDTLVWQVCYHFLQPMAADSSRTTVMAMQVVYDKDTLNRLETVSGSGVREIRLFADTLGAIKEIRGFIYYSVDARQKSAPLLVDRFAMNRYHCKDSLSVVARDSINKLKTLEADSLKKVSSRQRKDSLKEVELKEVQQRLTPEEMNRRRTGKRPEKKPEQVEVEEHIREERLEQRRERLNNQRRSQQVQHPTQR